MLARHRFPVALALVGLVWVPACSNSASPPNQNPPVADMTIVPPLTAAIELSASENALEHGVVATTFNFAQLTNLWVRVKLPGMPASARVNIVLTAPTGDKFYETTLMFGANGSSTMMMPGGDSPTTVFAAKIVPGGFALDTGIPVAGSTLTRYPMLNEGQWTATAQIDGVGGMLSLPFQVTMAQ